MDAQLVFGFKNSKDPARLNLPCRSLFVFPIMGLILCLAF